MLKLKTAMSEKRTRPHFASHTQSSLMKRRPPMNLKKKSSIKNVNESKKSKGNVILRLSGIRKKRSSIMQQSRSMQMMIMILKQQQDRRSTIFLSGSELIKTDRLESSLTSFQNNLIMDVSHNFKKCASSPVKLTILRDELPKVVDESERHAENSHASEDEINCTGRDSSENIHVSFENHAIVDVTYRLQLHSSDEEDSADSRREAEAHYGTESEEKPNDLPNEDCSEIETQVQSVNVATNRKRMRKIWTSKKVEIQNEHIDVNRAYRINVQNSKHIANPQDNSANDKPAVNDNVIVRKKSAHQKNRAFNQRAWRPAGISKTWVMKSATSLQPISQKPSHLSEKSTASSKNKYSSTKHVEAFSSESTSTSVSANQSKMLMKENRDPRANRMTKICEPLAETKQRQRLPSGGTMPKRRRSRTKIDTKTLDRNDANAIVSKSKSRHCQTRPIMLKEFSDNVEQHRTKSAPICGNRTKTLEVIHTLRKIVDSVIEGNVEESAASNDFDREKDDSEVQVSNRDDSSRNNELHIFTEDTNLDGADRFSRRSVSTQTELDLPCREINVEENRDLKISTRTAATQTSLGFNGNVVEIGCNTSNVVYNDAEVSCDLTDLTDSKTEVDSATIEDKSTLDDSIHTESSSVKHIEIKVESKDTNENKETLNIETSLKLDDNDTKISAKTTSDAVREKITHEKACQISIKLSKNSDNEIDTDIDKLGSRNCFDNHDANSTSVNNLFLARARPSIYDYDESCSSEEIAEYPENIQNEAAVTSELKVKDIPSDLIAAFELAAERARNIHKATIIYFENLMSRKSEKRNETESHGTSKLSDNRHCLGTRVPFVSRVDEDKIRSECDAPCHFANNEDFDGFSTCSSRGSSTDRTCQFERFPSSRDDDVGMGEEDKEERAEAEENIVLSENEKAMARSILNERSNLKNVKSLIELLGHRTQEEYAFELLQSERKKNDESFAEGAIDKTCLVSRENLLPLIYCVVCTVVFWFLQFSFRCDSTK